MAKEIEKNQKLKNEFITSITHDIRTPLTSITGWTELILMKNAENKEETLKAMKIIYKEAKRLKTLIEGLLDFSKFESGKIELNLMNENINQIILEVVEIFKPRIDKYEGTLKLGLDNDLPQILCDKNRIKQVLINIIDNSLKYSKGNCRINAVSYKKDNSVIIEIKDNGIGISQKDIPKLKEKFYRVNNKQGGSELGLAISDEIIKLHDGELNIQSQLGIGTTVQLVFSLPFCKPF